MNFRLLFRKIVRLMIYIFLLPIYWISCVVPKNNNLWIFGAWFGKKFADNSKYLFLYVRHSHPEIRAVWLSRNREVIQALRREGHEAYTIHSLRALLFSCRANCVVVCQGLVDVNKYVIGGAKKVQLWHGTPLKKIVSDDVLHCVRNGEVVRAFLRKIRDRVFPFVIDRFAFVIATSAEARTRLASAFKMPESRVRVTGYPRNDALVGSGYTSTEIERWQKKMKTCLMKKTVIGYLPTFRDTRTVDLFRDYGFIKSDIQSFLEKHQAVLWIKGHFVDESLRSVGDMGSSRIFVLSDEQLPDIYPILRETHILITDYSSVYFDYLLLDRPIIFAPFDLEEYVRRDRELYYDYDEVTPGPKAKNWPEVLALLEEIMNGKDEWRRQRAQICKWFNKFNDSESSRRVFEEILKLLNKTA